jgi:hypothetical protein
MRLPTYLEHFNFVSISTTDANNVTAFPPFVVSINGMVKSAQETMNQVSDTIVHLETEMKTNEEYKSKVVHGTVKLPINTSPSYDLPDEFRKRLC